MRSRLRFLYHSGSETKRKKFLSTRAAKSRPHQTPDSPRPRTSGMRLWTGATLALGSVVTIEKRLSCWTVPSRFLRTFRQPHRPVPRCAYSSSSVTSRQRRDFHSLSATYFSLAVTSMRAEFPSGKVPTTRVRLRISRFRRSMALLVRVRHQCSRGSACRSASPPIRP